MRFVNCVATRQGEQSFAVIAHDPYATLGQQLRAELDREAEAVAYLQARGYKIIKTEGAP